MNISKYVEFLVKKDTSKKTNKDYYCIVMRIKEKDVIISFLTENQYKDIMSALD